MIEKGLFYMGGGWGNLIDFFTDNKDKLYGFKSRKFAEDSIVIDLAHHAEDDLVPLYLIKNIRWETDPSDMFFADAELIGNIRNDYKETKSKEWFFDPCEELFGKYEDEYNSLSPFNFKRKKQLDKYLVALKEILLLRLQ